MSIEYRKDAEDGLLCKEENGVPYAWSQPDKKWLDWNDTAIRVFNGMDKSVPCSEEEAEKIIKFGYQCD